MTAMAAAVLVTSPPFPSQSPKITSSSSCCFSRRSPPLKPHTLSFPPSQSSGSVRRLRGLAVACLPSSRNNPPSLSTRLFVSGLSFRTTEESLRNAFQIFGELVEVNLVMDRIANRPRGFAFLRYATEEESKMAIEGMHGKFLDGRVIFVEIAKPRSELRPATKQPRKFY